MKTRQYRERGGTVIKEEIILTRKEQVVWYSDCVGRIMNNTRWVLDHLESLPEFQVDWEVYHRKHYHRDYDRAKKVCKKDEQ